MRSFRPTTSSPSESSFRSADRSIVRGPACAGPLSSLFLGGYLFGLEIIIDRNSTATDWWRQHNREVHGFDPADMETNFKVMIHSYVER